MAVIKVEFDSRRIYYRKGNGRRKHLCNLEYNESARRASKYKIIVVGSSRPTLYDMRRGIALPITKDSKIGRKYVDV